MKRLSHSQIQNLIFIGAVMLVAAGAIVYILLDGRSDASGDMASETTPLTSVRPLETEKASSRGFEAAPVSVMMAQLASGGSLILTELDENRYALALADAPDTEAATLLLTESNGLVTSLMWSFPLPTKFSGKPANAIERRLAESYDAQLAAMRGRVETALTDCIGACDLDGVLLGPVLLAWTEGALETMESGESYRNVAEGCVFTAYASEPGGEAALSCALLLP